MPGVTSDAESLAKVGDHEFVVEESAWLFDFLYQNLTTQV